MALSKLDYVGDNSTTDYIYNKGYILQSFVLVKVDGVLQVDPTHYSWINTTTIRFVTAPALNAVILLERSTSQDKRLVAYQSASSLGDVLLNKDSLQAFHLAQEAIDEFEISLKQRDSDLQWDALTKRITNVADANDPQDAATKAQLDAIVAAAGNVPIPAVLS